MERKTLAETMAEQLREAILAGVWKDGEALPTEPELADRFGVSRAVVRDATRIINAWGLVEPRQGKGVFVTGDPGPGFSEALLLALRRIGGNALDVEQVDFLLLIEAAALAANRCDEIDFEELRLLAGQYGKALTEQESSGAEQVGFTRRTSDCFARFIDAFYRASGNRLLSVLGPAVNRLRAPRHFEDPPGMDPVTEVQRELAGIEGMIAAVESGKPETARRFFSDQLAIHDRIASTLAETPVGEVPRIPMNLSDLL